MATRFTKEEEAILNDEGLTRRIQRDAETHTVRSDFKGVTPTPSMADTQGEAPPVAENVPTPTRPALPPVQTRTDTNLPPVKAGGVYRDAGGLHTGRTVTQRDFDEGEAQLEAYKRAHPMPRGGRVTENRYGAWHKRANTLGAGSDGSMGAWSRGGTTGQARPSARGFIAAAQQPAQTVQPVNRIQQIDQRAEAEAKAQAQKREQAMRDANVSVGEAFSEALRKFRDDSTAITRNGIEKKMGKDSFGNDVLIQQNSANRYRIGMLQPSTIRALNQQRSALGLKESDSIVGIYAVSGVDANGKPTGEPQIITNYRSADGRIHKKVYTYQEAARFVRGTMGEKGDAGADDRFASMKQWQDADGNDALGITRTAEYQERQAKLEALQTQNEAASLKNDLTRQQLEQGKAKFDQEQANRAEAKENAPVAALEKERNDQYGLLQKTTDPAMRDKIANRIMEIGDRINSERGRIEFRKKFNAAEDGDEVMPGGLKRGNEIVAAPGYEEFTDQKTKEKGFRVMQGVKRGTDGKPVKDADGLLVLESGWTMGDDGRPAKIEKPGAEPPTATGEGSSGQTANTGSTPNQSQSTETELDYDTKEGQAAVQKDIRSGGGEYREDENGYRTIRIGNWDYLSDKDKELVPEWNRDRDDRYLDIKAIHEMQKKANAARAKIDEKRKAEEAEFAETLKGKGLTPNAIEKKKREWRAKWNAAYDPAVIRQDKEAQQRARQGGNRPRGMW